MRNFLTVSLMTTAALAMVACGGPSPSNSGNAGSTANTNAATTAANANHPLMTTKTPEAATTNNAPTLGPVIQAYYAALKNKDSAAVRETMSSEFLRSVESDMK